MLGAKALKKQEHEALKALSRKNRPLSELEKWSCERTWIERFYLEPVTQALIELDDEGKWHRDEAGAHDVATNGERC